MMDQHALVKLEFDKIRSLLAEQTTFSGGRSLALQCSPAPSPALAIRAQVETAEGIRFIEVGGEPPFGGIKDVRTAVDKTRVGAVLSPDELIDVASTLRGAGKLKSYLRKHGTEADGDSLADLGEIIEELPQLCRLIESAISIDGDILDTASPALRSIRTRLRTAHTRVRQQLDAIIRSDKGRKMLQELLITIRGGRFVVPVKAEYRQEIPGIVHDQSSSGATVFIEPVGVVQANNDVRQYEIEEEKEIERILKELSVAVAAERELIQHTVNIVAELDYIFARSKLAVAMKSICPEISPYGRIDIVQGRHPLLTGKVVPIDVSLGDDLRVLVITGPNTGGKTVTLKTIGLFTIMAAAGLHVPAAPGTRLPFVKKIHVDIGDEQSIEQSLSTFSSHMTQIVQMQDAVDSDTLVLLDELGAGTDPTEGAALAIALLEHFMHHGALVVATTHYGELKTFAYTHPGVENASVQFDVETLSPTYKLSMGVAGESNAFDIAKRLGLSDSILKRAKDQLSENHMKVEDAIAAVQADLKQAEAYKEDARILKERYEALYEEYAEKSDRLQSMRQHIIEEAKAEAAKILSDTRRQADDLLGRLRRSAAQSDRLEDEAKDVRGILSRLEGEVRPAQPGRKSKKVSSPEMGGIQPAFRPGMLVKLSALNAEAEIVQLLGDGKLLVQAGALRLTVDEDEVQVAANQKEPQGRSDRNDPKAAQRSLALTKAESIQTEIHLRGLRVEEGLEQLDKYMDDAVLAGLDRVRIVHGKGTGRMKDAVHTFLRSDSRAKQFSFADPSEGGLGVTVVHL